MRSGKGSIVGLLALLAAIPLRDAVCVRASCTDLCLTLTGSGLFPQDQTLASRVLPSLRVLTAESADQPCTRSPRKQNLHPLVEPLIPLRRTVTSDGEA